jgi:hypothetical protein
MTPKEQSAKLRYNYSVLLDTQKTTDEKVLKCAIIAVDEILNAINPFGQFLGKDYWQEVKQELEKSYEI